MRAAGARYDVMPLSRQCLQLAVVSMYSSSHDDRYPYRYQYRNALATDCRLEHVADEAALTATILEVLPVCSPAVQQQLIGLLPEVVLPQDHEVRHTSPGSKSCIASSGSDMSVVVLSLHVMAL